MTFVRRLPWIALALLAACGGGERAPTRVIGALGEVARSPLQWTGVAVTSSGRVFACLPRWLPPHENSVVEVMPDGTTRPYPEGAWNLWRPGAMTPLPEDGWVCVQSVHVDARDRLWVLDAASPLFAGVVRGGAKLVRIDARHDYVTGKIQFDPLVAPPKAYLNDVRVDAERNTAYITDSGLGALIVVDLSKMRARRFLADHPSTKGEEGVVAVVGGREWRFAEGGAAPKVHADGLALDAKGEWLYWKALTGRTLWRARTEALRDPNATDESVAAAVEKVGEAPVCDGMEMDAAGNLYLTAIEQDAIVVRRPDGRLETLVRDERLAWPDSLALAAGPSLYVTTSQIHRTMMFQGNRRPPETPYRILRLELAK